jgi:hypothetical protein
MDGAGFEFVNLGEGRLAQAQDDVASSEQLVVVGGEGRPGFDVCLVRESGGEAEARLDFDLRTEFDEFGDGIRR